MYSPSAMAGVRASNTSMFAIISLFALQQASRYHFPLLAPFNHSLTAFA